MATAELAVALPVLAAVVLFACGVLAGVGADLRCADAARLAARSAARGDPQQATLALAASQAPRGAAIDIHPTGSGLIEVRVRSRVRVAGPLGALLPGVTVVGEAHALLESPP